LGGNEKEREMSEKKGREGSLGKKTRKSERETGRCWPTMVPLMWWWVK
jgi:hypothetical protein